MTNKTLWHQEIQQTRLAYGLSQNKLAVAAGISRPYLSEIETGKIQPSLQIKQKIQDTLDRYNPEYPLELLFDYVRIRFPTNDVAAICHELLRINMDYMLHEDYAFYSYTEQYRFGDIILMTSHDAAKGILLELKGKGCRQFENFLLAQHRSWFDFFRSSTNENAVFKRIDLAINDKVGILNIPALAQKCDKEECVSVFRSFKNYRSGELVQREEKMGMGNTLYIGSLKSEVYFCLYEKDYEQYVKNNIPIEDAEVKNRFEIRLKNERAAHAIKDLIQFGNAEKTAFEIINRYIRFVDKDETKRRSQWETSKDWAWFLGEDRGALRLTTKPEPYTYERTFNWLRHQVAPNLKVVQTLDHLKGTTILNSLIQNAELTEKHEKLIEQLSALIEDVTL
ncbi:TPA: MobT family relaxase [Enterococcus faecium]|nr:MULTISPECIES: MobT family relaxase [Enterococcus]EMF0340853.1 replication initiation factor domain-containing protein [Enterococcus faecium]MDM4150831.1 MobT family relaxase [Enterococcus faecalis]MDQ8370294.1 MobT family relaxase [Enterococcus faecium]MDQ8493123.1 MobT family relaxase [Enterococcus faecium]NSO55561.1 replication initiation factor [Enterococcus faecalis]